MSVSSDVGPPQPSWLAGGGEMGELIRAMDWSKTPIGAIDSWSPALRMMVRFLLSNRFPLLLWWGPEYVSIYNDPYRPILGDKHPWALGQPVSTCWSEIWHILQPLIDTPFHGGPSTWNEDIFLEINRRGFVEETHFTIAYSPVPDETVPSGIGGVLATVHEITGKVVGERRVRVLRDLGVSAVEAKSATDACEIAAKTLSQHGRDLPFVLLYLIDDSGTSATLAGASGARPGSAIAPLTIDLSGAAPASWPLAESIRDESVQVVTPLHARFAEVPAGPWSHPPDAAALIAIPSNTAHKPAGVMVAGLSPRLTFDEYYADFLQLVRTQIATGIATARAYDEERKRAEALANLDRAKTIFFSNVSHEFRTPLTLMLGPLEDVLGDVAGLSRDHRERLRVSHRHTLRLLKLVNTLLDFSRIEAGRLQASYEQTDVSLLTAELASVFRSAIERAGLRLVVDCPPIADPVYVDREMWEKILFNLLSNAFKYTIDGEIGVSVRAADGAVRVSVRDTGTGIPAAELPHIFERFPRVENARGRSAEGTGIGLALVQELVRLHGGRLQVESELDGGSTFTVTIPTGHAHLPADRIGAARTMSSTAVRGDAYLEEALRWLPEDSVEAESQRLAEAAWMEDAEANGPRARILVADDNRDMRDYLRRLLAQRFDVDAVGDGVAALHAAQQRPPDLLLTDVMMPVLDGFGLLTAFRADPHLKGVPVIMLSARAGEEARVEGMEAGADDYLVKPFSARELLAHVEAHLHLARVRREMVGKEQAARAAIQASEEERRRIARELHDELGQQLTALALGLKAVRDSLPPGSAFSEPLQRLQAMTIDVGREVHRVALELRPAVLDDLGLRAALSTYVEDWSRQFHIGADFQSVGLDAARVPSHIETTVYRVVQEALTNVARHAKASSVNVILQRHHDEVIAIVEDDGCGFDAPASLAAVGDRGQLGLLGMKERVALVGGRFTVESRAGATTVHVRIPVEPAAAVSHV